MTKKDYVKIAAVIRSNGGLFISGKTKAVFANLTADMLAADNPRFDRSRFLDAALGDAR